MNAALLSPSALSMASEAPNVIIDLLSKSFSQDGKFYIDSDGAILSYYSRIAKNCDKAATILSLLALRGNRTFIKYNLTPAARTPQKLEIDVAACAFSDRNILTDDDQRYSEYADEIDKKDILIFPASRFENAFRESQRINYGLLSRLLLRSLETMTMQKSGRKIEDLHNDFLTALMRQHGEVYGFSVADQSRTGCTIAGNVGELDLFILKGKSIPFSVIECLRSDSFGSGNNVIPEHLDKLLHNYDKLGFTKNFLVTYSEAKDFRKAYEGYIQIIREINSNKYFKGKYKAVSVNEGEMRPNLRSIVTTHEREGMEVQVIHYFCDFS